MTIKLEDIRVGDELGFKPARVTVVGDEGVRVVFGEGREAYEMPIPAAIVSTHTPAPREFKHGDEVRNISQFTNGRFFIIATFGEWAWVRDAHNWTTQFRICELRHADPALAQEPAKERKKIEKWFNVYPGGMFYPSDSRGQADAVACHGRIACLHVEGYEGDGL